MNSANIYLIYATVSLIALFTASIAAVCIEPIMTIFFVKVFFCTTSAAGTYAIVNED